MKSSYTPVGKVNVGLTLQEVEARIRRAGIASLKRAGVSHKMATELVEIITEV